MQIIMFLYDDASLDLGQSQYRTVPLVRPTGYATCDVGAWGSFFNGLILWDQAEKKKCENSLGIEPPTSTLQVGRIYL